MPKSLKTFLEDCCRETPDAVVRVTKEVDPAHYDVTAIIKHLGAMRKFPILIFDRSLNLYGRVSEFKLVMNCEVSQRRVQIALGLPREMNRSQMAEACLELEQKSVPPVVVGKREAPVKEIVEVGPDVDLFELPIMRHHEVDATCPLDRPFSPASKCPDGAMQQIKLEDYIPWEVLQYIPIDRTTYWC